MSGKLSSKDIYQNATSSDEMFSTNNMTSSDTVDLLTDFKNQPSSLAGKPYKCSYCKKSFTQSGHLTTHVRTHTGDRPFQCPYCPKAFTDRGNLNTHIRTHTGEKPFKCELCGKAFTFHIQLSRHKKVCISKDDNSTSFHIDEKNNNYNTTITTASSQPQFNNFTPDICPIQSSSFSENNLYSASSNFILTECPVELQPTSSLFYNKNETNNAVPSFQNEASTPNNIYIDAKDSTPNFGSTKDFTEISADPAVSNCGLLNTDTYNFYSSVDESLPYTDVSKHGKYNFPTQTNSVYVTANMSNTGFNSKQIEESDTNSIKESVCPLDNINKYDKIIYIDSDSAPGTSEEAKSVFDAKTVPENISLSNTSDLLTGDGKTPTDIGLGGADNIVNQEDETINTNTVSKKRTHRKSIFCDVCKKTFHHSYQLVIHLNSRNCQRNFECKFCGKTFLQIARLNSHLHTHTGAKPYKCSFCGKGFADRSNLKSHRRLHTGEKPFKCTSCLQQFTFHIQLNRHKRNCKAVQHVTLETSAPFSGSTDNNDADTLLPAISMPSLAYNNFTNTGTNYSIQLNPDFIKDCDSSNTLNNSANSSNEANSALSQSDLINPSNKDNIVDLTIETPDNYTGEHWKTIDRNPLSTFDSKLQDTSSKQPVEDHSDFSKDGLNQCHIDLSDDYDNDVPTTTTSCDSNTFHYSSLSSGSQSEEVLLSCQYCYKTFTKKEDLTKHLKNKHSKYSLETFKVNTNKKPYTCKFCPKSFMQPSHLNAHIRTHTGDKPFTCQFCNKAFSNQSNLNTHMRLHTKVKPFICPNCNQSFTFHIQLQRHKIKCFGIKNLSTQYPSKEEISNTAYFSETDKLSSVEQNRTVLRNKEPRHLISSVKEANGSSDSSSMENSANTTLSIQVNTTNQTDDCLGISVDVNNQVDVGETKENESEINEDWKENNTSMNTEINQSNIADTLLRDRPTTEDLTLTENSSVEPVSIDKPVELIDKTQAPLQSNLLSYHPGKKLFRCKYCKRNFLGLYLLSVHLRSHNFVTSEKMFECALCKKSFQKAGQLNSHVRTHTGVKPFLCQYCGKAFADRSNLNTHRRTHTGEKPFKCLFCGKAFTFHIQLSRHKRVCKPSTLAQIHQYQKRTNSLQIPPQSTAEQTDMTNNSGHSKKLVQADDAFFVDKTTDSKFNSHETQLKDNLSVQVYNDQTESLPFSTSNLHKEAELLDHNDKILTSNKSDNLILSRLGNSLEQVDQKPNINYHDTSSIKDLEVDNISTQQNLTENQCDPDVYNRNNSESHITKSSRYSEDQDSLNDPLSCNKISGTANKSCYNDNVIQVNLSTLSGEEGGSSVKQGIFYNLDENIEMRSSASSYIQRNRESLAANNSLFPCCYCGKVYKLVTTLAVHIRLHTGSKVYECEFCGETFFRFTDLAVHLKLHPQEILFQCEYCDMTFTRDCHLRLHEKSHFLKDGVFQESLAQKTLKQKLKNDNNFICPICHCIFPNSFTLDNHLQTHSSGKLYHCQTCKQAFASPLLFKRHSQECQLLSKDQDSNFITAPISTQNSQTFSSQNVFRKELVANKTSHDNPPQPVGLFSNTGRLSSLAIDLWKLPPNIDVINQHKKQLTDNSVFSSSSELNNNGSFMCNYCERKFPSCKLLNLHLKTHSANFSTKKVYRCEFCMKLFFQQLLLDKHKRTHHAQNLYSLKRESLKCRFCSKTFQQTSHLKAHIRHHTGDKPFKCQYCGKAFSDRSNLNTHIRTHTGEKPFKCTNCSCAFTFHIQLTRHKRICQSSRDDRNSTTVSGDRQQLNDRLVQSSNFSHCFSDPTSSNILPDITQSTNEHSENINLVTKLRVPSSPLFFNSNIIDDNSLNQSRLLTTSNSSEQFIENLPNTVSKCDSGPSDKILTTGNSNHSSSNLHSTHYNTETDILDCKPSIEVDSNIDLQSTVNIKSEPFPSDEQLLVCPSEITSNLSNISFNGNTANMSNDTQNAAEFEKFQNCVEEEDLKPDIASIDCGEFEGEEISKIKISTTNPIQEDDNLCTKDDSFSDTNQSTCSTAIIKAFEHVDDVSSTNPQNDLIFGSKQAISDNDGNTHFVTQSHSADT